MTRWHTAVAARAARDARERLRDDWQTLTPEDLREIAVILEQARPLNEF